MLNEVNDNQLLGCKFARATTHFGYFTHNNRLAYAQFTGPTASTDVFSRNSGICSDVDFSTTHLIAACAQGVVVPFSSPATQTIIAPSTGVTNVASYSPDQQTFAYGGNDKRILIMNGTGNNFSIMSNFLHPGNIISMDFSDDSNYLLVGTSDGTIF